MSTQPDDFMLVNAQMAIKNGLGEVLDAFFAAKTAYAEKLGAFILLENDPEKLKVLNSALADVLVSQADLDALKAKMKTLAEFFNEWKSAKKTIRE